jgi:hypothetical protein
MKNKLKLAGLLVIALIMVLGCTPKKSGTTTLKQNVLGIIAMENPPETVPYESTDVEETSSEFIIEGTTLKRYTGNGGDVIIPSTVTVIGEAAFIVVPGAGRSPERVTIPSSVTTISERAFQNCADMTSVTFNSPSSLTVIKDYAFLGCSDLTSINIPSSVTVIGDYAFEECASLTSVTMSGATYPKPNAFPEGVQINYRD